ELEPSSGSVSIAPDTRMSVLKQDHFAYDAYTVLDTVIMGNEKLYEVMKEKDALYMKEDFNDEDGVRASELEGIFAEMNGWEAESDASRLIGAPPGYVGYDEGGQLTEAVRRRPYAVILFDEVEKAHPDVFNVLLQVLDDGRITDSQGRTVDFKNTIIILTSNLGSPAILDGIDADGQITDAARNQVEAMLRSHFRPEFLNRLDEIVFYKPLTRGEIDRIVDLQTADLNRRLNDKQITMQLTAAARAHIVEQGYDPIYGARPLKRFMQRAVETLIARKLIAEDVKPRSTLTVDYDGSRLFITTEDDCTVF
ncbi:MAG: AAA family ATPase, partial [Clostridia bacterium]|nr:AAA family ATPase [Clostridia bacterium]